MVHQSAGNALLSSPVGVGKFGSVIALYRNKKKLNLFRLGETLSAANREILDGTFLIAYSDLFMEIV